MLPAVGSWPHQLKTSRSDVLQRTGGIAELLDVHAALGAGDDDRHVLPVRQLLQMVDGALARIREGSFGECISCGKEINAKRLEAVPWTRHCIECQEKLEKGILEEAQR